MVGAGIFSLPQTFGRATGPLGAIIAWTIAGAGMLALALTFQVLARRKPEIEGGVYGYARAGFGAYLASTPRSATGSSAASATSPTSCSAPRHRLSATSLRSVC